jgi:hypothetical protein
MLSERCGYVAAPGARSYGVFNPWAMLGPLRNEKRGTELKALT